MKRSILFTVILLGLAAATRARSVADGISVEGFKMERDGRYLTVEMTLDLRNLDVDGNRAVLLTPCLVNGNDSLDLPSVGIYGRRRYYLYVRNGESMLSDNEETHYKASQKPNDLVYNKVLPYEAWMNGAALSLRRSDYGCCNTLLAEQTRVLGDYAEVAEAVEIREEAKFLPVPIYVRPEAERVKSRSLEGSAYIDFPASRTEIVPEYRRNSVELSKIRATIDSVRNDRDITITSVWLKGYASPEGSYALNEKLAVGRTEALKAYIQQLYRFDGSTIAADYGAEDWAGLRRYVEHSDLNHKMEILALIDSDSEPDVKEWKIKSTYPEAYRLLLQNCYPALRHTDYRIAYEIRSYSDVEEIKRIMGTQPQKLSLNEFYLVAQECEPGTSEFAEVFETAVRMFPKDETANLNAANAAMARGDNAEAERYLAKAGNSPEAVYSRGALAVRTEDYGTARRYLNEAKSLGVEQAAAALDELDRRGL